MPSNWFIVNPDRELGPHTSAQMKQLASLKQLKTDDLVRRADRTKSVAAGKVQGLFPPDQTAAHPKTTLAPPLPSEGNESRIADRRAMSKEWYYAKGDQKHGPITSEQFRALAMSGALARPTSCGRTG